MAGSGNGKRRLDPESHYHCAAILHKRRRAILELTDENRRLGEREISAVMQVPPAKVAYHLRVLVRCGALKAVGRAPPRFTWSPQATWLRKMLKELDELTSD
ncbi:MAG: hypothetical protein WA687_00105 [Solirubrobacterales bacterium]